MGDQPASHEQVYINPAEPAALTSGIDCPFEDIR
jgi:hypothetical protein